MSGECENENALTKIELMDDLCQILLKQQWGDTKVPEKLSKMTVKHEEDKKAIQKLLKDLEAALPQPKEMAELEEVTRDRVQNLREQMSKMQDEKRQVPPKALVEVQETRGSNFTVVENEKTHPQRVYKRLQSLHTNLSEKTKALDESLASERCLRDSLKKEQERVKNMLLQHKTQVRAIEVLSYEQMESIAASESLENDIYSVRMENACTGAKYNALEKEYDRMKARYHSVSERCEELAAKNNDLVFKNRALTAKLQNVVDKHRARELEWRRSETQLQNALKEEKERCSELEQRAERLADKIQKQKSIFEKNSRALEKAVSQQLQLIDEKQTLSVALHNALDSNARLTERLNEEAAFPLKKTGF
ncbi:uncharacterized protein LOC144084406 [Stigmatopora argus]